MLDYYSKTFVFCIGFHTLLSLQLYVDGKAATQEPNTARHTNYGSSSSFMTIAYRAPIDNSNNLEHTAKTLA